MTAAVLAKLLALIGAVALGALAGRRRWLGADALRVLGNAALLVFVPALLFRTAARVDVAALPWTTLAAYFVPVVAVLLLAYALLRWRMPPGTPAAPAVRALDADHRAQHRRAPGGAAAAGRAGLERHRPDAAGAAGRTADAAASAVVPVCLILIGLSLAHYGLAGRLGGAGSLAAGKLLLLPAAVLVTAHWGFGLAGLPLAVAVMMAALPAGSHTLIFAQRYATLEGEATAVIVLSTLGFVLSAPLWLALLALLPGP